MAGRGSGGGPTGSQDPTRAGGSALKLFYYCYGGAHSSVTAANIHLGNLPSHRRPPIREILHQPRFDRAKEYEIGEPVLMGPDDEGHEIYAVGLGAGYARLAPALEEFLQIQGVAPDRFALEGTLQHANMLLRVGGFTSRRLGIVFVGRPMCGLGVWLRYHSFIENVTRVRHRLRDGRAPQHNLTELEQSDIMD